MSKQIIISVGREYGSCGHLAAEELARRFGLEIYDRNLLDKIAEERGLDAETLRRYDEGPRRHLFSRNVKGHVNSPEEHIAKIQFDYLREKAERGESFVVVGRCAEEALRDYEALISFFVVADLDFRVAKVMELDGISREEATELAISMDKKRKLYHNYHSSGKWGDSRTYDICISCSRFGFERMVDIMEFCVRAKFGEPDR